MVSKIELTSWTMKLSHVRGHFSMVTFPWFDLFINAFTKVFGPLNQTWTKRSDLHQKIDVLIFECMSEKEKKFFMFNLLPFFFPYVLIPMEAFSNQEKKKLNFFKKIKFF